MSRLGKFLDNKRNIIVAAPHQSGKDEYLMIIMILAMDVEMCYLSARWTMRKLPNPYGKSKDIDEQGIRWPLGWLQEIIFRNLGAIPVDRKGSSGQYQSVVDELKKRDSFVLIIAPEARFDATRFRTSFIYLAKELILKNIAVLEKGWIGGGNVGRNTTIIRSNYLLNENEAFYEFSLKLWETLEKQINYNAMVSQRGVLNVFHSDAQRDAFIRRGNFYDN